MFAGFKNADPGIPEVEYARERLDFVSQKEFDALAQRVTALEERLRATEGGGAGPGGQAGAP